MSAALADVAQAEEQLLRAALRTLLAERGLADETGSVTSVNHASERLAIAARDLVRAVDELPREKRPKGWGMA